MGFIGKIFKNKQIVTIVALIVCFAILVFAYRYRVDKAISAVSVPIATKTLNARDLIDESCFETKKVAQSMLTNNVITNTKELVGDENTPAKYVNYNTFIPEGSLFYRSAVTTWDHMPDSAWADIPDGQTVIYLGVNSNSTYGNTIYPTDKIDLYYSNRDNEGKLFFGPLITGIEVKAVKDSDGSHIFKKGPEQKNASALIFVVSEDDFLLLKKASYLQTGTGEITPVPKNAEYSETAEKKEGSKYITDFINKNSEKTTDVSNKNVKSTNQTNNNIKVEE